MELVYLTYFITAFLQEVGGREGGWGIEGKSEGEGRGRGRGRERGGEGEGGREGVRMEGKRLPDLVWLRQIMASLQVITYFLHVKNSHHKVGCGVGRFERDSDVGISLRVCVGPVLTALHLHSVTHTHAHSHSQTYSLIWIP